MERNGHAVQTARRGTKTVTFFFTATVHVTNHAGSPLSSHIQTTSTDVSHTLLIKTA